MRRAFYGFLLCLWLVFPTYAAEVLSGRIVGVQDGDTVTLLTSDKRTVKIRLAEIDAPELKQPYGQKSKQILSGLAFDKEAVVTVQDIDRYGRTVGRIEIDGLDVNAEMVRQGAAWVYRRYASTPALYEIEAEARQEGRGLWHLPEADRIPPWEWRRRPKTGDGSRK